MIRLKQEIIDDFIAYHKEHPGWGWLARIVNPDGGDPTTTRIQMQTHAFRSGDEQAANLMELWSQMSVSQQKKVLRACKPQTKDPKK